jgi:hypothetical protein
MADDASALLPQLRAKLEATNADLASKSVRGRCAAQACRASGLAA